mgnify:CR=1 FL=1
MVRQRGIQRASGLLAALPLLASFHATGSVTAAPLTKDCPEGTFLDSVANECVASADDTRDPADSDDPRPPEGGVPDGDPKGDSTQPASSTPAAPRTCTATGSQGSKEVPCENSDGWWSDEWNCRVQLADPQPPKSDPAWKGNTEGAIYTCTLEPGVSAHGADGYQGSYAAWSRNPPAGPAAPVDPEQVARRLVARLGIKHPNIASAPTRDGMGIVGLPTWVWIDDPTSKHTGPLTTSASERGLTVRLSARVKALTYDFGERGTLDSITCPSPGVPFEEKYADQPPPGACLYTYKKPGNYTVTATAHWVIDWRGGGQSGTFDAPMTDTADVSIGENQVINGTPRTKKPTF